MLIFDELKKNDLQLRLVAMVLAAGFFILLVGLWWVQIVLARDYQNHLETQSYRTVRLPAVRGKILDRENRVLAENRPQYNISLYLDDLRGQFESTYRRLHDQALIAQKQAIAAQEKKIGRALTKAERKQFELNIEQLREQSRFQVAYDVVAQVGRELGQSLTIDPKKFNIAYEQKRALPFVIVQDASPAQVARFEERNPATNGADLDVQSTRIYPLDTLAGHVIGYLRRDDSSEVGEDAYFSYRLPDYRGVTGIEWGFDSLLRGRAGGESVLVNNLGYRESENVWSPPEPGHTVVLTIDMDIQRAAQQAILQQQGPNARAAAVVMDVRNGDILAMASSPMIDPNYFVQGFTPAEWHRLTDTNLNVQVNRASQGGYLPGSIFKPVVGLAALDNGLDPNEIYDVEPDPEAPWHGCIKVGRRLIGDTVPPGKYDFKRALEQSSNSYFIFNGMRTGIQKIIRLAEKFHFGEGVGLPTRQDTKGYLPTLTEVNSPSWHDGNSANICFGQGEISVTPLQMAVAYSAIANGGTVFWPRLVERIEPQDLASGESITNFPAGLVRDRIGVTAHSLKIVHDAMLGETEEPNGTAYKAFHVTGAPLNLLVCGKTGTAQVEDPHGHVDQWNYWFASFAPYQNPHYAVIVMVQSRDRGSGGSVCAPIAHDIYQEILNKEKAASQSLTTNVR